MKEDWVKIFTSDKTYQAKLAEDVLKQNGIESHIVNRPDSVLPSIGEAALYTVPEKAERALQVLRDADLRK